jgi:hypothetical protein
MALKDLIAQKGALTESAIEEIVSEYVRYDPESKTIAFIPGAANLPNKAKVLVYLVALQGWPFVSDDAISIDAKPGSIEEYLGIPGGTLRPILKELKDRHVIAERNGRYFVRPVSLSAIKSELTASGQDAGSHSRRRRKRDQGNTAEAFGSTDSTRPKSTQGSARKSGGLSARFNKWIDDGFFKEPKTLADVQRRFHKEGEIVPQSTVSPYLLSAVRSGRLTREEEKRDSKRVWTYQTAGGK